VDKLKNVLREGRALLGVSFPEEQEERMLLFVHLLNEANRSLNLTGFRTEEDILVEGVLDSLTAFTLEDLVFVGKSLLDVGTGGGIPGIPLKIACPSLKLTLIEATAKKCHFLETTLRALGLEDVDVFCERAETLAHHPSLRERFDLATARALGSLREVLELTTPFLRCGGLAFYYKGREAKKEVEEAQRALEVLRCSIRTLREVAIPFRSRKTTLVLIEKKAPTPLPYPRRPGIPKKRPL